MEKPQLSRELITCSRCGHVWFTRLIPMKVWYQCPNCHLSFKLKIAEVKSDGLQSK